MKALTLPLLFFIASFADPSTVAPIVMGAFWKDQRNKHDALIVKLLMQHETIPNMKVIWLDIDPPKPGVVDWYWPAEYEQVDAARKGAYGLVMFPMEQPAAHLRTWWLRYCFDLLAPGGKMLILNDDHVIMAIEKDR